ncbi:hypothetical protein B296_00008733 [Ensete ventricosum]|uniref:Uncharacterized protein n=1 Tax=Ensete ventricosum TaxID=4639 RepID=A0A427ATD1_ENSVE|nr:hypothetical protein B296_00008733 [Ensete ventricosum]
MIQMAIQSMQEMVLASGDLDSFDTMTDPQLSSFLISVKLVGCFIGKCSGSIRSIARHPEFPMTASCGKTCLLLILYIQLIVHTSTISLSEVLSSLEK